MRYYCPSITQHSQHRHFILTNELRTLSNEYDRKKISLDRNDQRTARHQVCQHLRQGLGDPDYQEQALRRAKGAQRSNWTDKVMSMWSLRA